MGTVNPDLNDSGKWEPVPQREDLRWLKVSLVGFFAALVSVVLLVSCLWWRGRCCEKSPPAAESRP